MSPLQLMAKFGIDVAGIIHVGANNGAEAAAYKASQADTCVYIEPIPAVFEQLKQTIAGHPGHIPIQALCSDVDGEEITLNIANNNGESSSMFALGKHSEFFPAITYVNSFTIASSKLDTLIAEQCPDTDFNLLVIDTQGADLKVLQGATELLKSIDGIFVEVSEVTLYVGGCTYDDIVAFLKPLGFWPKWMEIGGARYGDAFFLREQPARSIPPAPGPNIALGKPASQSSLSIWSSPEGAQGGNNGTRTGFFGFHTAHEQNPWWQVDLEANTQLIEIRIYNRLDNCRWRARYLQVLVSSDAKTWDKLHDQAGHRFGGIDGKPLIIPVKSTAARYVRLQLPGSEELHLDEIEIY